MAEYPGNQLEFEKSFSTEAKCLEYLTQIRWPNGFQCCRCNSNESRGKSRRRIVCKDCGHENTLLAGTVFHRTHLGLDVWFRTMWWVTNQKHGVSALGLQRTLGLGSYQTAWKMLQKLRGAMVRPGRDLLSGDVEVDETFIGASKHGKRGRGAEGKQLVVIAVEINDGKIGRIRMRWIPDASEKTLLSFVRHNITAGSTVVTDGWKGYLGLSNQNYKHRRIPGESVGIAELLPHVHQVASLLKRWILGTLHGGIETDKHLDRYLDEFIFRFNRRTSGSRGLLFRRLLENAVVTAPQTYDEIIKNPNHKI